MIGPAWTDSTEAVTGRRRLDDPSDYVRAEVRRALERNIKIVPALIDGATMPVAGSLPADIDALRLRNAVEIRPSTFRDDLDRLAAAVRSLSFVHLAVPAFAGAFLGAAFANSIRVVAVPASGSTEGFDSATSDLVAVVGGTLARTGVALGIAFAAKRAIGLTMDRVISIGGLIMCAALFTTALDVYVLPLLVQVGDLELATVRRVIIVVYHSLAAAIVMLVLGFWAKLGAGRALCWAVAIGMAVGVANQVAFGAERTLAWSLRALEEQGSFVENFAYLFRDGASVPAPRLLVAWADFPLRWGAIVAAVLALVSWRVHIDRSSAARVVGYIVIVALVARIAGNALAMAIGFNIDRWGVSVGLIYAILVPLAARRLIHLYRQRPVTSIAPAESRSASI